MSPETISELQEKRLEELLCDIVELAVSPEYLEEAYYEVVYVVERLRDGFVPNLGHVLGRINGLLQGLCEGLSRGLREQAANDAPGHPTRAMYSTPQRVAELGVMLAELLDSLQRRDVARALRVPDLLPSDIEVGHSLSLSVLVVSFRRHAARVGLSRERTRTVLSALKRVEIASTQRCFDFALPAAA